MSIEQYSLSIDFNGFIDSALFDQEVLNEPGITTPYDGVNVNTLEDSVSVVFLDTISNTERTVLNSIVSAHPTQLEIEDGNAQIVAGNGLSGGGMVVNGDIVGDIKFELNINGLIETTSPSVNNDFIVIYETSSSEHKKVLIGNAISTEPTIFDAYDAVGGQTFTTATPITLNINTIRETTSDFSLINNQITCIKSGMYSIIFRVSTDISSGSARSTSGCLLQLNTGSGFNEVAGSRGYMYNRTFGDAANTATVNLVLDLNSGDILRIGIFRFTGSDNIRTMPNASGITIYSIGSNGKVGPAGADGDIVWQGEWVSQNYVRNQAVSYLGTSYVCKTNTTSNQLPTNTTFWDILAQKGDTGPVGSGSNIIVQENGVNVSGSPFEKINFIDNGNLGLVSQNGMDSTQVDISLNTGFTYYGALTTDPVNTTPNAGDKYYNTVLNHEMFYDASRSKWLSVALLFEGCGLNGTTNPGGFYRRFNGMGLDLDTGPFIPKGTIVALSFGTTTSVNHTFEVLVGGSVIASLVSNGQDVAYSNTINADFNGGKFSARNASTSSITNNFQGTVYYRLRV